MMLLLCLLVILEMFSFTFPSTCPHVCSCKWKNGKQTVECRHKGLVAIPMGVHSSTQVIDLTHNSLDTLPPDAFSDANLLNLQKIFMKGCHLRQVDPSAFSHLSNLIEIDMSENRLKEIPSESFEPAFELRELNLRRNPLRRIRSHDFVYTTSLTRLDLSFCLIASISFDAFEPIKNLLHLKLQGNKLTLLHPRVIHSLSRLHGVEIHENPWACDCRARPFRKWTGDIPHSQSPTCETPPRIRGRFIDGLSIDDFACPPQTLPTQQILDSEVGGNSSLWCPVSGIPPPVVSWLIDGHLIMNGSILTKTGVKALIYDVKNEDRGSLLHVIGNSKGDVDTKSFEENLVGNGDSTDSFLKIRCIASNPAGAVSISFTLTFYHPTIFGMFTDETMKIVVLLLAVSIFCLFIATLFIALFRRRSRTPSIPDAYDGFATIPYNTAYADGSLITNEEPPSVTANKYEFEQEEKPNVEMVLWAPERALAVLDSAAPEHVIQSYEKDLPPSCRTLLTTRRSSIYCSQKRFSYLPDFAPNFLEPYQFEQVTTDGRAVAHSQTLPRTLRLKPCLSQEENLASNTLPHTLWTSSCRQYSQPVNMEDYRNGSSHQLYSSYKSLNLTDDQ